MAFLYAESVIIIVVYSGIVVINIDWLSNNCRRFTHVVWIIIVIVVWWSRRVVGYWNINVFVVVGRCVVRCCWCRGMLMSSWRVKFGIDWSPQMDYRREEEIFIKEEEIYLLKKRYFLQIYRRRFIFVSVIEKEYSNHSSHEQYTRLLQLRIG
jgi:hypothetical protein